MPAYAGVGVPSLRAEDNYVEYLREEFPNR